METGVFYLQFKIKDFEKASEFLCKIFEMQGNKLKYYVTVVPDDAMMIQASVVDEWLMKSIEIWKAKGYDIVIQGGKPTPPPCPPGGCQ